MRFSELSPEQRAELDDPESFPRYVRFLGKEALLGHEELRFLREHGVDFEIGPEEPEDEGEGLLARLAHALRRRKKG